MIKGLVFIAAGLAALGAGLTLLALNRDPLLGVAAVGVAILDLTIGAANLSRRGTSPDRLGR